MNKSVLVIGGSGFLGSSILATLQKENFTHIASADRSPSIQEGLKNFAIDILDYPALEKTIRNFDVIINCVGQITSPINTCLQLNSQGITNLAKAAARGRARIIHISTVAVYGTTAQATEDTPSNPETPYATCKAYAEFILQQNLEPKNLTILRLSNLYGEVQKKGIIAYFKKAYQSSQKLIFNNNGELRRYYLNVDDCARVIVQAVKHEKLHGTYNLIGNEQFTIKELLQLLKRVTGKTLEVEFSDQEPEENIDHVDDSRIHQALPISHHMSIHNLFHKLP